MQADASQPSIDQSGDGWSLLLAAWLVSLTATLGALFIGEVMGQTPCLLCWYQRAFMFPLSVILAIACFKADSNVWRYALPLSLIGLALSSYHMLLYAGIIPEALKPCGKGPSCASPDMTIFGSLPIPTLSLAAFLGVTILLILARRRPNV
jgi:disulfide bond formation protein DsbB